MCFLIKKILFRGTIIAIVFDCILQRRLAMLITRSTTSFRSQWVAPSLVWSSSSSSLTWSDVRGVQNQVTNRSNKDRDGDRIHSQDFFISAISRAAGIVHTFKPDYLIPHSLLGVGNGSLYWALARSWPVLKIECEMVSGVRHGGIHTNHLISLWGLQCIRSDLNMIYISTSLLAGLK